MSSRTGTAGSLRRSVLGLGLVGAIAVAACGGSSSPAPTGGPGQSTNPGQTLGTGASQAPETQGPGGTASGGNGLTAFSAATTALDGLDSYLFKVEIKSTSVSGSETTASHTILSGEVVNKPTKASILDNQDLDETGTVTSETAYLVIGPDAWLRDGDATQAWTSIPAAAADAFVQSMSSFRPEQMFGVYFAGLGGDFSAVGMESKNGVQSTHYQGNDQVGALLGTLAGVQGTWSSDVWIANDGGYLVHSEASAQSNSTTDGGSFLLSVDISSVNSAPAITPPPG